MSKVKPRKKKGPTLLTPDRADRILTMIREGCYLTEAARVCRIHVNTLRQWCRRGADVVDDEGRVLKRAREPYRSFYQEFEKANGLAEVQAVERLREGGWQAQLWFLRLRFPERWGNQAMVERKVRNTADGPPPAAVVGELIRGDQPPVPWPFGTEP